MALDRLKTGALLYNKKTHKCVHNAQFIAMAANVDNCINGARMMMKNVKL